MLFKNRVPKKAAILLLTAILSWAGAAVFTFHVNPEIRFYEEAIKRKRAWADRLNHLYSAKTVIYGGSSCAFSIDGERMEKIHGLPTVNFGLHAGFGAQFLSNIALTACRSGDTLAIALEPDLLAKTIERTSVEIQLGYALGEPSLAKKVSQTDYAPQLSDFLEFRPGGQFVFTMLGKVALRKPAYRYQINEVHESGWQTTSMRVNLDGEAAGPMVISKDGYTLLNALRKECDEKHIHLVYSLPWFYVDANAIRQHRTASIRFLEQIIKIVPALRDPYLGACSNSKLYADSRWHLTEQGAAIRTDALAQELRQNSYWDERSLAEAESAISKGIYEDMIGSDSDSRDAQ